MELTICPNCPEKAIRLGCCFETNLPVYWCPACGSIKPCTETWMTPMKSDPKYSKYFADKDIVTKTKKGESDENLL